MIALGMVLVLITLHQALAPNPNILLKYWDTVYYQGHGGSVSAKPDVCTNLVKPWRDAIQSVQAGVWGKSGCLFHTFVCFFGPVHCPE